LTLSSPALPADAVADARFSCAGAGVSPPLLWLGVPADTAELAVVVIDLDTPGPFVHWALAGIDPKTTAGLGEGAVPKEVLQARNSTGKPGWQPFCPPVGETHRYQFSLYALGAPSDITALTPAAETVTRLNQEPASVASFTVLFNRS
jgi:Raf kinase inhibitor-like YbhB/YbcL family protein